ncbi:MAG TPA: FAD-dependent oxidoreductase [Candidatus Ventrimonas merdavium]|nr:FAD-dependent oxidoreductase [Candidatus Ventrimonas merdavium]
MKKRLLALLMASAMVVTACGSGAPEAAATTAAPETTEAVTEAATEAGGTYTGKAAGFHGDITVEITVEGTKITDIQVVEQTETENIGGEALPTLVEQALKNQTTAVNAVSGATVTSDGFRAALEDAIKNAGLDVADYSAAVAEEAGEKEEIALETDIVVVGAGGAGLTASLATLQNGASVILLEKMAFAGGASAMAGAGTTATGSKWLKEDGVEDSPEQLRADLLKNGHGYNHEPTVDIFVNTVGEAFDWLVDPEGANVEYQRPTTSRTYSGVGRGAGVTATLLEHVKEAGGEVYLSTPATELLVEDGKVTGVKAESDSAVYTIQAKSVILATGGFGANSELVPEEYQAFVYAGAAGATGDALEMTKDLDPDLINMEFVNVQPNSIVLPSGLGQYCNPGVNGAYKTSGAFLVNENGVRFANEEGNAYDLIQAMKENASTYLILDQASFDAFNAGMTGSKIYTEDDVKTWLENNGSSNPVMIQGDSLEDVAKTLGIPEGALTEAKEAYNTAVDAGTDEFGRTLSHKMSEDGPYYAVQMWLRYYATLGGLHINEQMQVLNTAQEPIEGLYAAGEVVGGLEGDIYLGGTLFGWAMTSGYDAGKAVSEAIK